jgi:tetraacyldisaccharide 4'-kinase
VPTAARKATPTTSLRAAVSAALSAHLQRTWWQPAPDALAQALRPLAALAGWWTRSVRSRVLPEVLPVPVLVVGNLVVGGAGKTPTVIALVQALRAAGWTPGVISRGYGAAGATGARAVSVDSRADDVGDEPLLIARRTGAPVWVGARRVEAARGLLAAHPGVDLLLSDDGLQHHALPRCAEVLVFDERGAGNGLLLPAGPLRQPMPAAPGPAQRVLYTAGVASTPLPGALARRRLGAAVPLAAWWAGSAGGARPLPGFAGQPLRAVAGLGAPEKFFAALRAHGLNFTATPLPDHAPLNDLPWPAGCTDDVLLTEKDAVKLPPARASATPVWVVPLDLVLPEGFVAEVMSLLPPRRDGTPS